MAQQPLPELLEPKYDENHRGMALYNGSQVSYSVLLEHFNFIMLSFHLVLFLQLTVLRYRPTHKLKKLDPRFYRYLAPAGLLPFALTMDGAALEGGDHTPL